MKYIEALNNWSGKEVSLFMGGGISGCYDWQSEFCKLIIDQPITLINPRRRNFPIDDPSASEEQIKWEHLYLEKCSAIMFWFPSETLCPITLFELGTFARCSKKIFVGCHPDYKRKLDVVIQMGLYRPEVQVVDSLEKIAEQVKSFIAIPRGWDF